MKTTLQKRFRHSECHTLELTITLVVHIQEHRTKSRYINSRERDATVAWVLGDALIISHHELSQVQQKCIHRPTGCVVKPTLACRPRLSCGVA